jgi:hypothetical protein
MCVDCPAFSNPTVCNWASEEPKPRVSRGARQFDRLVEHQAIVRLGVEHKLHQRKEQQQPVSRDRIDCIGHRFSESHAQFPRKPARQ